MAETIIHRYDDRQRVAEFAFNMEIENKIYPMVQHNNDWYVDSSIINIVSVQKAHTLIDSKTYFRIVDVLVASIPDNFEKILNAYVNYILAVRISENTNAYSRMKKELFDVG